MDGKIGLRYPESIDKISASPEPDGGFYRLSIGHFESWDATEDPCGKLREKLEYYLTAIKGGGLAERFPEIAGRTARITLMTDEALPEEIEVCFGRLKAALQSHGVPLDHWIIGSTQDSGAVPGE